MQIKKNIVDVNFGRLFPWQFQFVGGIILFVAIALSGESLGVSIFLILLGLFILSASEGTEINRETKMVREYKSFFFLKTGQWSPYEGIEKIFVNSSRVTQQMHTAHTNKSSVFTDYEYNGYLKFDDGTKMQLLRKKNKVSLLQSLKSISTFLQVPLEDNTGN
jgi:hypothetical protein